MTDTTNDRIEGLEHATLELERRVLEEEIRLKQIELEIEKHRLTSSKSADSRKISPLTAAVIAALFGLLGTAVGAIIQGYSQLELSRQEFETNLILKAIETNNQEEARTNLTFFVEAGFLSDPQGKIATIAKKGENVPILPRTSLGQIALTIRTEKQEYKIGERFKIGFCPDADCFLYLFHLTTDMRITWLYPFRDQNNFVEAGTTKELTLIATEPVGFELFIGFASKTRVPIDFSLDPNKVLSELNKLGAKSLGYSVRAIEIQNR